MNKKKLLPPFLSSTKDVREDAKINVKVTDYMNDLKRGLKSKKFESKVQNWDEKFWYTINYIYFSINWIHNMNLLIWIIIYLTII